VLQFYLSIVKTEEDKERITNIYNNYYPLMMHVAMDVLHHRENAEDVVQSTMLYLISRLDTLDLTDEVKTRSLCCIAVKNRAINLYRSIQNKGEVDFEEAETDETEFFSVEDAAVEKMMLDKMRQAFEILPQQSRDVCILKYTYGMNDTEIAYFVGVSPKAVGMRIVRAKNKIRKIMLGGMDE